MVDIIGSLRYAVYKQFHPRCIGTNTHIHRLSQREIPIRENMHHRCLLIICPLRLIHIGLVFKKARRIDLSEVRILRMVRGRFPNIIKPGPDKLPHGKLRIPVGINTLLRGLCPPTGGSISESGTLLVIITQYRLGKRELINATALYRRTGLATVNVPIRMLLMMLFIAHFTIIISGILYKVRTLLRIFPRHIVGTDGHRCINKRVMLKHRFRQILCNLQAVCIHVGIVNLVSDAPHEKGRMIPVTTYPACHIHPIPLLKKACIIVRCLTTLPHIKGLRHHQKAHFIRQVHKFLCRHIVGGTQGIDTHFPELFKLSA